jgi:hypothetical protein
MRQLGRFAVLFSLVIPLLGLGRIAVETLPTRCTIESNETIPGNLYTACNSLIIDGTVEGDVITGALSITVNGAIQGDLIAVAGNVMINGTVGGHIRMAGGHFAVTPGAQFTPDHDIALLGLSAEIAAPLPGNLYVYGYQAIVNAPVLHDVRFEGATLMLNDTVGGRVDAVLHDSIQPPDLPWLDLRFFPAGYTLTGQIAGDSNISQPGDMPFLSRLSDFFAAITRDVLTFGLVGLLIFAIAPRLLNVTAQSVRSRPLAALGSGALIFILIFPALAALALLSLLIGVLGSAITLLDAAPLLGITLAGLNLSVWGGVIFLMGFLTRAIISFLLGQWIIRRFFQGVTPFADQVGAILTGTIVYTFLGNLPLIGWPLSLVAVLFGLGALSLEVRSWLRDRQVRRELVPDAAPTLTERIPPAPLLEPPESPESLPGMDNLPEGFTWFED